MSLKMLMMYNVSLLYLKDYKNAKYKANQLRKMYKLS